jgi:flavin reductase (DIM6/NTAB) family NADH-FMN oxidoreductase RutF
MLGYRSSADKLAACGLTAAPAQEVGAVRLAECPIQLEAVLQSVRSIGEADPQLLVPSLAVEVRVVKVHARREILSDAFEDRIDPERWQPLIMSFRQFLTTGAPLQSSRLALPPEEAYAGRRPRRRVLA